MKKQLPLFFLILFSITIIFVQAQKDKKTDPRHQNMYKSVKVETEDILIEIIDANAQTEFCKMKLKITNKTKDIILYKPEETEFVYDFGTFHPKAGMAMVRGKNEIIQPKETNTRVITVNGDTRFHVENFTINFKGFYRVSTLGTIQLVPDFRLPASSNDFIAGNFKCLMTNIEKETQQTQIRFKASYANDSKHYGLVVIGKPVLKIEDGREFAMVNSNDKIVLLSDGEDDRFTMRFEIPAKVVDMQFATMNIVWKDTFRESEAVPMEVKPLSMTLDPGMTDAKNK